LNKETDDASLTKIQVEDRIDEFNVQEADSDDFVVFENDPRLEENVDREL